MSQHGYYHNPAIHHETIYFVSEDDLWSVPHTGGVARRLTSGLGAASYPAPSPDGRWLAYCSSEEGVPEVHVMPLEGGPARRLTYEGKFCGVVGWTPDNHRLPNQVVYSSIAAQPFSVVSLRAVSVENADSTALNLGTAEFISFAAKGRGAVLMTAAVEAAHWKRYRGGTAGDLWIDTDGAGEWRRLISLSGNPSRPLWIGERIYFISDHEGIGNLYSCTLDGGDLRTHTEHSDFYARNACSDGRNIVYQSGGDLFLFDPASQRSEKIAIDFPSPRTQRNRKFVDAGRYLEWYIPHPKEESLALTSRGKVALLGDFEGPVRQIGEPSSRRQRLATWLHDGKRLATIQDAEGEEILAINRVDDPSAIEYLRGPELSRIVLLEPSPCSEHLAVVNVRNEVVVADLQTKSLRIVDRNRHAHIDRISFSPDGRFIAYTWTPNRLASIIRICCLDDGSLHDATIPVRADFGPVFDPQGDYLFFIGLREFNPVYDTLHFDLGFPKSARLYSIALRKDVQTPFGRKLAKPNEKNSESAPPQVTIDFDGIEDRIEAFPMPEGRYDHIEPIAGKVLFKSFPVEGSLDLPILAPREEPEAKAKLEAFDFETRQVETWIDGITSYAINLDRDRIIYRAGNHLRVIKTSHKPEPKDSSAKPGLESGWIDLGRVKVPIDPSSEWRQMYGEAWRLQREQYWIEDMADVDWKAIHDQYLPLVDRVGSRGEFEDLLWEMQSELGSSHAYASGGDFRKPPQYPVGFLGADMAWDHRDSAWKIQHIVRGDPSDARNPPPLMRPGVNVREGAIITAVNNRAVTRDVSPARLLVHQAGAEVVLTIADTPGAPTREVVVKASPDDTLIRYREWVERNRLWVHEQSAGRCGYLHVPDMGPWGYSEFHRLFLVELDHDGLIVDVRYNRGGHVSALLLEKLARRRRGLNQSRWFGIQPVPDDTPAGPMVAITNQYAGSDGDIFSHGFKRLKLGPLIGKRTWGGVIGIWPRHLLADGGITTQPEFAWWFDDVGWNVENRGVEPDIEVEFRPQDYAAGRDPQLERGLAELLKLIELQPKTPAPERRPSRAWRKRDSL